MKACLVEIGFIDNKKDVVLLKSAKFKDEVAEALADAIADTEGLKLKKAPAKPIPSEAKFRVVAGSFAKKKNAEERVKELKGMGIDAFILSVE